ncbi:MAG: metallophosphoesterase [Bacillota bacterium]|nr:metallophosphoesterase [Bacillota bacterium]
MRIGVLSDTHGNLALVHRVVEEMGSVDLLLHAGDYYEDSCRLAEWGVRVVGVVGNCDCRVDGPAERLVQVGGKRLLLTHGHRYRVKQDFRTLLSRARELNADAVVFGHTHRAEAFWLGKVLFFNPGSLHAPCGDGPSYGVLVVGEDGIRPELHPLRTPSCAHA